MSKGKKRVRRGRNNKPKDMLREIRKTTNFNKAEYAIAERNRESHGITEMGAFIRTLVLNVPLREQYTNPAINKNTADMLKSSFSCFNQALNIIHLNSGVVTEPIIADLLGKYFAFGKEISKCRQELYGKFDKRVITNYALSMLSSDELIDLADKALVQEELAQELGLEDLEAEYDM